MSVVRLAITELLRGVPAAEVARKFSATLRRTEESRIYHWHRATGRFPPPRPRPPTTDRRQGHHGNLSQ